ncbi:MAG: hypothetical protein ISQ95_02135, partial [Flavobacteriales bacterium]|nr:hypothetical protein [Flavobacteriales bacterium]
MKKIFILFAVSILYINLTSQTTLSFDGTDDYVAVQNKNYQATTYAELTVESWIRTTVPGDQIIASFDRSEYWRFQINGEGGGDGQLGFSLSSSAGILDFGSNARVDDGQWHHVAGVFDNGIVSIYIDGILDNSTTTGSTFGTGVLRYGFLGVGSEASNYNVTTGPDWWFNGNMTETRVWSVAKTASEILANYNTALTGNETNLDIYYNFSEGSGATLNDLSSVGYDGTIYGATWVTDNAPVNSCTPTTDFNYGGSTTFCNNESNPVATITGVVDGEFSSSTGLALDAVTGAINLSGSVAGSYDVSYSPPLNFAQMGVDIDGYTNDDRFGTSVALNKAGDVMVVGAQLNDASGGNAGQV